MRRFGDLNIVFKSHIFVVCFFFVLALASFNFFFYWNTELPNFFLEIRPRRILKSVGLGKRVGWRYLRVHAGRNVTRGYRKTVIVGVEFLIVSVLFLKLFSMRELPQIPQQPSMRFIHYNLFFIQIIYIWELYRSMLFRGGTRHPIPFAFLTSSFNTSLYFLERSIRVFKSLVTCWSQNGTIFQLLLNFSGKLLF